MAALQAKEVTTKQIRGVRFGFYNDDEVRCAGGVAGWSRLRKCGRAGWAPGAAAGNVRAGISQS